ncbi:MAG: hypothetical protein LBD15_02245 [Holosporales bacterium]|jgi:hypothetical protein|nr:hypothetical protein [Holosporales bacterium]
MIRIIAVIIPVLLGIIEPMAYGMVNPPSGPHCQKFPEDGEGQTPDASLRYPPPPVRYPPTPIRPPPPPALIFPPMPWVPNGWVFLVGPVPEGKAQRSRAQKFTHEEDERLRALVAMYGESDWSKIAMDMPSRTSRQCRERWRNYLDPGINNRPWTLGEDRYLIRLQETHGNHPTRLALFFSGRTPVNIKNHLECLGRESLGKKSRRKRESVPFVRLDLLSESEDFDPFAFEELPPDSSPRLEDF